MIVPERVYEMRRIAETQGLAAAAHFVAPKEKHVSPDIILSQLLSHWLEHGRFHWAAVLLWGPNMFTPEPLLVQETWGAIDRCAKLILIGAGSLGKSYNLAVWTLLDWLRDPEHTLIQVLSVTKEHAKTNVFAHIKALHAASIMVLPGEVKAESIRCGSSDKSGIVLRAIKEGDAGYGTLRGFHPSPRVRPHPVFGRLTRLRLLLDEAEEIPIGIWEGVDNMLVTESAESFTSGRVKIMAATNPRDKNSELGQRVEPDLGWMSLKSDIDHQWWSKRGWFVQRLDAARCENVVQKREVFPGMQTWDGYKNYLDLGIDSPDYWTMARGWFPEQGVFGTVIPEEFVERNRGSWVFITEPIPVGGQDLALVANGDAASLAVGKFGLAKGWVDLKGQSHELPVARWVIQVESTIDAEKGRTDIMAANVKRLAESLGIKPEWFACDSTGIGRGVFDILHALKFECRDVDYSTASTHTKMFEDDKMYCDEMYEGVVTELMFGLRRYLEFGYLKFSPTLNLAKLRSQLCDRRYEQRGKGKVRVEAKDGFKSRGHKSPDEGDALTLLVHVVRMQGEHFSPAMVDIPKAITYQPISGPVDNKGYVNFEE